jgi:hypothetical protein
MVKFQPRYVEYRVTFSILYQLFALMFMGAEDCDDVKYKFGTITANEVIERFQITLSIIIAEFLRSSYHSLSR